MYFLIASLIIAVSCSLITTRVLVSYNNFGLFFKLAVGFAITVSWFMPPILHFIRRHIPLDRETYALISDIGYTLFGFVFILFVLLMLRDFLWFFAGKLGRWRGLQAAWLDPKDAFYLGWSNLVVVLLAVFLSVYAVYEAVKIPNLREVTFTSPKIKQEVRLVHLSDLHINKSTPAKRIQAIVEKVNAQNPDFIVITGDSVDAKTSEIRDKVKILSSLKSKEGVFVVIGNHELYSGLLAWLKEFERLGFKVLFNDGVQIASGQVYLAGVADTFYQTKGLSLKPLAKNKKIAGNPYRILLAHYPQYADYIADFKVDLQLSGHTHGGQIFPFHFLVWRANKYLAGSYRVGASDLYVSRGAGYWGPPMRLFAPSEIALIKIKPQNK